jgi:pilus assembly protein CpaC
MGRPDDRIGRRRGAACLIFGLASFLLVGHAAAQAVPGNPPASLKDPGSVAAPAAPTPNAADDTAKPAAPAVPPGPVTIVAGPPAPERGGPAAYGAAPASYLVEVGLNKSQVLDVHYAYNDLMLANAGIADVIPLSNHTIYIVAKGLGSTSLSVYGLGRRLVAMVNINVGPDIESLKTRLHELLPEETDVTVRLANGTLILAGTVTSGPALSQVLLLANAYAPNKVVNMMSVQGTQQVMLSVRFVEMERSTAKNLNITLTGTHAGNPLLFGDVGPAKNTSASTPAFTPFLIPSTSYGALGTIINGNIGLEIDALETKGLTKTLAEPTLVAMSGDTASFLAGGEIPIPVSQASSNGAAAISVTFQQFGIGLAFTPTILKDGVVNLVVKPEVSSLDTGNGVTLSGFSIPGIKVRRASTTVEMRDGESFVIAGLLSDTYINNINQFPFLGDTPVLGALFRSPNFQRDKTELVIVVTPHLVTARSGRVALPTDTFATPSDLELFLLGNINGAKHGAAAEDRALMSGDPTKCGIDGPYGHVLY